MDFEYTARTTDGAIKKGALAAESESALASALAQQGMTLTMAKPLQVEKKTKIKFSLAFFDRVTPVQKIFFTQNLSIMVKTGLPLSQALKTLEQQAPSRTLKKIFSGLSSDVEGGITLSQALSKYPKIFPELFVNMISAGEQSGKLDETLVRLTIQMRKDNAILGKVRGALTYPVIVIIAMVAIGIGMTIFVIPQLTSLFQQENASLPLPTKVLIAASDFLIHQGVFVAAALALLVIIFIRIIKTKKGRLSYHRLLLSTPVAGPIIKKINLTRFMRTLSSLLITDIPIIQSFQIISRTLSNALYSSAMNTTADEVKRGTAIFKSLERYPKLFPPIITQMISIGEQSGTLDEVSLKIADFYEEDVEQTMATLSTVIEPVLMIILGVAVALMAVAIIMPMYSLTQVIN